MKKEKLNIIPEEDGYAVNYILDVADVVDAKIYDMSRNGAFPEMLPCDMTEEGGQRIFSYSVQDMRPLSEMFKVQIDKEHMLTLLHNILHGLEKFGKNMISLSYVAKDPQNIFVSPEDYSVKFVVIPVDKDVTDLEEIRNLIKTILVGSKYNELDTDNYVARLINAANMPGTFSSSEMKIKVSELLLEIGINRDEELETSRANQTEEKSGNSHVLRGDSAKVSRLGVMRNNAMMSGYGQGGPNGQPMGPNGQPMPPMGPNGQPMPPMGPNGQPMPPMGPNGQPMPPMGPNGQPMPPMGPNGQPMPPMGPNGRPLPPMGPNGRPLPPMGPNGRPLPPMGSNGRPLPPMGPNGRPLPPMGPDGRPLPPMGPDGQPLEDKNMLDKEGSQADEESKVDTENALPDDVSNKTDVQLAEKSSDDEQLSEDKKVTETDSEQTGEQTPEDGSGQAEGTTLENESKQEKETTPESGSEQVEAPLPDDRTVQEDNSSSDSRPELEDKPVSDRAPMTESEMNQGFTSQFVDRSQSSRMPQDIMNTGISPERENSQEIHLPQQFFVRTKTGERINIDKAEFKIGHKASDVDYAVSDNSAISRVHCVITKRNGVCFVRDNKSTNGTFVNGSELPLGKEQFLTNGASVILGDEEFIFHVE
jgi:hypothetical protein